MDEKKFESFEGIEQKEANNEKIQAYRGKKILTMLAIATTLATTSCDIPPREERVANRIERRETRAAKKAEISANEMKHVVFLLNSNIDTYEDLVDKYDELVDRLQPGQRNAVLERNIAQVRGQIKKCEEEINKLSKKYFDLSYSVSINQGGSSMQVQKYDKGKYEYLRQMIN